MTSILCFGSIPILAIPPSKKKVCNFVGRVVSPLLANMVLSHLEWHLEALGYRCVRDADDWVRHEARIMHGASAPTADQRAASVSP